MGRIMTHNLERDMKDAKWFVDKVRASESYSQNLYAALCNNAFQKLDVMPILKDEIWSCTWRYAGGIVADIRCEGDYIDWYCSGIGDPLPLGFVHEQRITEEIAEDFKQLGWVSVENYYDDEFL